MTVIVLPNVSDVRENANKSALSGNIKSIQTASDGYTVENNKLPSIGQPEVGKPQPIAFKYLHPKFTKNLPKGKDFNYMIDHTGTVHASTATPPENIQHAEGLVTWDDTDNADHYKVYKENRKTLGATGMKLKFVTEVSKPRFDGAEDGFKYYISAVDRFGNETAASGTGYLGWNKERLAMRFDGEDDYVEVGTDLGMDITDKVTVEMWIRVAEVKEETSMVPIAKYHERDYAGWEFIVRDGYIYLGGRDGREEDKEDSDHDLFISTREYKPEEFIADGEWHHVVGVINKNIWKIYIDGELISYFDSGYTETDLSVDMSLNFGKQRTNRYFFEGELDDIRIYNQALNDEEIKEAYKGHVFYDKGLVGAWDFSEGSGDKVVDKSNNKNNGTIHGAEWFNKVSKEGGE